MCCYIVWPETIYCEFDRISYLVVNETNLTCCKALFQEFLKTGVTEKQSEISKVIILPDFFCKLS